ncbi:hypothetical protein OH76DRAFT_853566 [Lentinus brumalis]|uniref:Uncharacterized protein n=1 Tax=Lentinus brumalis TaxID=2498619 RepID=A0A371DQZ7_9APHY|nr:hypothetical protein OH76DRAFT_853566 [Polyporus brumalis]
MSSVHPHDVFHASFHTPAPPLPRRFVTVGCDGFSSWPGVPDAFEGDRVWDESRVGNTRMLKRHVSSGCRRGVARHDHLGRITLCLILGGEVPRSRMGLSSRLVDLDLETIRSLLHTRPHTPFGLSFRWFSALLNLPERRTSLAQFSLISSERPRLQLSKKQQPSGVGTCLALRRLAACPCSSVSSPFMGPDSAPLSRVRGQ